MATSDRRSREIRSRARRAACHLLIWLPLLCWSPALEAGPDDLLVVVNVKNPVERLESTDLQTIFLTKRKSWDNGEPIVAVNLPLTHAARERFDRVVNGFDADEAQRYWIDRKVRGGARPPQKLPSVDAVLALVESTPGAIGYVPESRLPSHVKVVARIRRATVSPP